MNHKFFTAIFSLSLMVFLLSACTLMQNLSPATENPAAAFTQAAQTIIAQLTAVPVANTPVVTPLSPTEAGSSPTAVMPSATPFPTATALPPTSVPTNTSVPPTATAVPPTHTPVPPTATPVPIPCNWAQFLDDVTVEDGATFTPGSVFTKTWLIKNIGTCTWTPEYSLVHSSGERFDAKKDNPLKENVRPGESVLISVEMLAPGEEGDHQSFWVFRSNNGNLFGIGPKSDGPVWAKIEVVDPDDFVFDFTRNYCVGRWRGSAGKLPCPGQQGSDDGFVLLVDEPKIEIGRNEDELSLWTNPPKDKDAWIEGEFPALNIQSGDHFKTVVGCLHGAEDCNVVFQLNASVDGGAVQTLWQTQEVYDDAFTKVDVDLSSLAGKKVVFFLKVLSNGASDDDRAFWLLPRIER